MKYLLALYVLFCSSLLMAQVQPDNPNLDQVPWYLLERASQHSDAPLSSIVTVNNWDNFSLGVDFAENNMAMKPSQPNWVFTAYNTENSHHTENGIDWAINNPNFGVTVNGDPVVAYDSLGNLYYENMYGGITGCKIVKSTNNGATWNTAVTAIAGVDKNWLACDQTAGPYANYVYTTMTASSGGNFARSTNYGVSFTNTFTPSTQSLPGMMVCVGPQGNIQGGAVYVVTNSGSSFAATYTFYRSNDGGATFSQRSSVQWPNYVGTNVGGRNSVQNMRTRPYPMIAADNSYGAHRGKLYCVYASNTPSGNGNKPDIFCRASSDGGANWGSAIKVNDDLNSQNNHQWHPAVWCDKQTGRLYVMWMDTRDTPTSDSAYIYASYSENGGASFVTNQRISNAKMKIDCSTCGGGGTPRYQGDYSGVVSNKKVSMIGWTDFRSGTFQSMTAYFPDFAMSIDHSTHTLYTSLDSATFTVSVPQVKLYTDTVQLTTTISPIPATGTLTVKYPSGSALYAYPGSKPVRIVLNGNVPTGNYTVTFTAASPNGTPVHRRTAIITVQSGITTPVTVSLQPDRGKCVGDTVQVPIRVTGSAIHDMTFYITYDHTKLSQSGTFYTGLHSSLTATYNATYNPTTLAVTLNAIGTSGLTFSATRVISLIFTITATGSSQLHLRRSPDTSPISYILNNAAVQFTQVTYADNSISGQTPLAVSVSIESNPAMPMCGSDWITFHATPVNAGSSPFYQWKINGINAGPNSPDFESLFINGSQVMCQVTSNLSCVLGSPASSNTILVSMLPFVTPSVLITPSANPAVSGFPVTFTASPFNGGTNPVFQWKVNGTPTGGNNTGFTYTPQQGDVVTCTMTSSVTCPGYNPVSSSPVVMSVYVVPVITDLQNVTINNIRCYDALTTISVAGSGTSVTLVNGAIVRMIAGEKISIMPSTKVLPGAYLYGYIAPEGPFCYVVAPPTDASVSGQDFTAGKENLLVPNLYPNPTTGTLWLEVNGIAGDSRVRAELFGTDGVMILESLLAGKGPHAISLAGRSPGLYFLRVTMGGQVAVRKIILAR